MLIGGLQKFSLIDYPGKSCAIVFTQGCNFRCPYCFPGNTEILTDKGLFKIRDIIEKHIDCKVYDYAGRFSPIKKHYKRETNFLLKVKPFLYSNVIRCTPNHKFFVYNHKANKFVKKEAQYINVKEDYLIVPIPQKEIFNYKLDVSSTIENLYQELSFGPRFNNEEVIREVKESREKGFSWRKIFKELDLTDHIRRVVERKETLDGKILPIVKKRDGKVAVKGSKFYIDNIIEITPKFMRLLGYYLSEGCSSKTKERKNSYYTAFTFNSKEREHIRDTKEIFFEIFKTKLKEVENKKYKTTTLVSYKGIIGLFFKYYFGKDVYNKKIPMEFLYLDKNLQKQLIAGLFRGDGISSGAYIRKYQKQRIQITSKTLLYQIGLILLRLGIKHSVFRKEIIIADKKIFDILGQEHLIIKKSINTSKRYGFIDNNYLYLKIKSINKIKKKAKVYNLEIDNPSHSYNVNLISVSNCHNPELVEPALYETPIPENYVLDFLKRRKNMLDGVTVTGGEPLLQKDLRFFLKNIKEMGYAVKLDTNGSFPGQLKKIIKEGLADYIAMDIKAPLEKYDSVTRVNVNTKNIQKSIDIIMHSNLDYQFRTTVLKSLLDFNDLKLIHGLIKKTNNYILQKFKFSGKILDNSLLDKVEYEEKEIQKLQNAITVSV
ncbi:MAG: anaerobic ribonucleoside-triphosphate reductase activating protein [Candidatus Omnitrophica bacterium 4484_171]|nr:MAG: anaerobic ribonucleoside-triphosphate reductase activating protein [Candidatus Omnitrophica bacterium 4484_171]